MKRIDIGLVFSCITVLSYHKSFRRIWCSVQIQGLEARSFAESEMDFALRWLIDLLGNYCHVLDCETRVLEGRNKFDQLAIARNSEGSIIPPIGAGNTPISSGHVSLMVSAQRSVLSVFELSPRKIDEWARLIPGY